MICWARYLFIAVVLILGTLSMMSACGRKGPLYLPKEQPAPPPATSAVPTPATADDSPLTRP